MMFAIAKRLAHRILRLECTGCGHVIWAWQPRCGYYHTEFLHQKSLRSWRANLEATGGPATCWPCSWCHRIPTEARP